MPEQASDDAFYGNYQRYYGYRCTKKGRFSIRSSLLVCSLRFSLRLMSHLLSVNTVLFAAHSDPRLPLMRAEWFAGKRCLDIGCNAGAFTVSLRTSLSLTHAHIFADEKCNNTTAVQ